MNCGQTPGCIEMPLGVGAGLDQSHIVLNRLSSPPKFRRAN